MTQFLQFVLRVTRVTSGPARWPGQRLIRGAEQRISPAPEARPRPLRWPGQMIISASRARYHLRRARARLFL